MGTISGLYASLRLLFSRIGTPYVGTASYFSFNDPNGMCKTCSGLGKITKVDVEAILDLDKSWNECCVKDSLYRPGSWYWKQYAESGLFDLDKSIRAYSAEEYNLLLYGNRDGKGEPENPKVTGLYHKYTKTLLNRDISSKSKHTREKSQSLVAEMECTDCHGQRLNEAALSCKINGYSIADMCAMELSQLREVLSQITDPTVGVLVQTIIEGLDRMIEIGLPYLHLNRDTPSLSGGEAQRLKLVRYVGSSLTGMTYIFDEPSAGMHPRDVYRMNNLLRQLRDKGNTVLVVEHDKDVISIADHVIDVGPGAGQNGGEIVFAGSYEELLRADTLTGRAMRQVLPIKETPRQAAGSLPVRDACLHNLKHVDVDIPLGVMTVVTGVAGSGKSTLISQVFTGQYESDIVMIDQGPITATNRSTPASYLGFFDEIRKLLSRESGKPDGLFSFNSAGSCPVCGGKGVIVTELAFMDPIVTECEACGGVRYNEEAFACTYKGKNIVELLGLTASQALEVFDDAKIRKHQRDGAGGPLLPDPGSAPQHPVRRRTPADQTGEEPWEKGRYYRDGRAHHRPAPVRHPKAPQAVRPDRVPWEHAGGHRAQPGCDEAGGLDHRHRPGRRKERRRGGVHRHPHGDAAWRGNTDGGQPTGFLLRMKSSQQQAISIKIIVQKERQIGRLQDEVAGLRRYCGIRTDKTVITTYAKKPETSFGSVKPKTPR